MSQWYAKDKESFDKWFEGLTHTLPSIESNKVVFRKTVDWSTLNYGISVPVEDTAAVGINRKSPAEIFTEMPKKVFGLLLEKNNLRYNDSMRMVVASPYAYGDAGRVGYVGYSSTYTFNTAYYGTGGYAGADGNKGASTYDSSMASFYHFYNTAATSSNIHPIAEVKYFTPIIYEFVVKEPKIQ